jgi:hypothetical protein
MAGDWIKMRTDLHDDPSVVSISQDLSLDEFAVIGRLHRIWSWFDSQSRDGNARGVTVFVLDRLVSAPGFAEAMKKAGWLTVSGRGIAIPNFDRHNGQTGKARALARKRQDKLRHKRFSNAPGVTKRREEKSKEKVNQKENGHFIRPTVDQVSAYCLERKNSIDPQAFLDHYESNGWKVGKAAMKDWKAAVRTWERNSLSKRQPESRVATPEDMKTWSPTGHE